MNLAANDPSGNVAAAENDVVDDEIALMPAPGGDAACPPSSPPPVVAPFPLSPEEQYPLLEEATFRRRIGGRILGA